MKTVKYFWKRVSLICCESVRLPPKLRKWSAVPVWSVALLAGRRCSPRAIRSPILSASGCDKRFGKWQTQIRRPLEQYRDPATGQKQQTFRLRECLESWKDAPRRRRRIRRVARKLAPSRVLHRNWFRFGGDKGAKYSRTSEGIANSSKQKLPARGNFSTFALPFVGIVDLATFTLKFNLSETRPRTTYGLVLLNWFRYILNWAS